MCEKKCKIFRDPIYGYVSISEDYCREFIDTSIFQRLRRIEQTSMRILYPSAHHDRFAHSIGVFHLGQIAFTNIEINSKDFFKEISPADWMRYKVTFEIACLMHDCGHSPFSHTFEDFYLHKKELDIKEKITAFFEEETTFEEDYDAASPASHEKISALLLLDNFYLAIEKHGGFPRLAARMIMGCRYENPNSIEKFENKLISMLNGSGIDVDSLDYIQRDSWISGVSNVEIDYQRLLSSIMIKPDHNNIPKIVFKKSALSVLDNISIGRNFLYKWIYSHHIVNYEQYLLKNIIEQININSDGTFCNDVFSIDTFKTKVTHSNIDYYLPSDDDLMHTIKHFHGSNPLIEELLSRRYKYKALWKTYFEFHEFHFKDVDSKSRMKMSSQLKKEEGKLSSKYSQEDLLCIDVQPKLKSINPNDFFIDIDDKLIDASKATSLPSQNLNYFIVYVSPTLITKRTEILYDILQLQG